MNISAMLAELRVRLDDENVPYRHSTDLLVSWIGEAEREAAERARLLVDSTTVGIGWLPLISVASAYALDSRVLFVQRARIEGDAFCLRQETQQTPLIAAATGWPRQFFLDFNSGALCLDPAPDQETVAMPSVTVTVASWSSGVLALTAIGHDVLEGDMIDIDGNIAGTYAVTGTDGTAVLIDMPTDPGAVTTISMTRHRRLHMTAIRLPLAEISAGIDDDVVPEIPDRYHRDLLDWCCHLAYLLRDSDTESFQRSAMFEERFSQRFGPRLSARDQARLSRTPIMQIHPPFGGL